jgi:hypothetical protein
MATAADFRSSKASLQLRLGVADAIQLGMRRKLTKAAPRTDAKLLSPIEMTFNQIKSRFQKLRNWDEATRGVTEQHAFNTFQHVRGLLLAR